MVGTNLRHALVVLAVLGVVLPVSLTSGGRDAALANNSTAAQTCQQGGYRDWSPDRTTPFRNAGECPSFVAYGGTLAPLQTCPATTQLALNTTNVQSATPTWQTTYSIATTYDIFFAVDVVGPSGSNGTPTVDVFMPNGSAYDSMSTAISSASIACGKRFWYHLPLAGTWIDQYSLTGMWTAAAYLGGRQSVSTSFTLTL